MTSVRILAGSAAGLLALVGGSLAATGLSSARPAPSSATAGVDWRPCPTYSDEVLGFMVQPEQIPLFRREWARTECGLVRVPLDYRKPAGRRITIAITRLPATDRAHRKGSLALNPGGPGGSGYLTPIQLGLLSTELNREYDLIGFDPRGIGYSTKVACEGLDTEPAPPGRVTEEFARSAYAEQARANTACGSAHAGFLRQVTTTNIARDLDRIRAGLGERRLSFVGVSWGTHLGAVYRSEFPARVGRMWLDSVAMPGFRLDRFEQVRTRAGERGFARLAAWMAARHATFGFGTTASKVEAGVLRLLRAYDESPRTFTDLPAALDGTAIGISGTQDSQTWPVAGKVLQELRDAAGPTAPPTVEDVFGGGTGPEPPEGMPELYNPTMARAAFCNEDTSPRDFASGWDAYRQRLDRFPVAGRVSAFTTGCAGWPWRGRPAQVSHSDGSLVLSGHRYESASPYEWTREMRSVIGGRVFTVEDDVHGSVLLESGCRARLEAYFSTGRVGRGCPGVPVPSSTTRLEPPREKRLPFGRTGFQR